MTCIVNKLCSEEIQEKIIIQWKDVEPHAYKLIDICVESFSELVAIFYNAARNYIPLLIHAYATGGWDKLVKEFKICFIRTLKLLIEKGFSSLKRRVSSASAAALDAPKTRILQQLESSLNFAIDIVLPIISKV